MSVIFLETPLHPLLGTANFSELTIIENQQIYIYFLRQKITPKTAAKPNGYYGFS